jgi:hypothetical protein
MFYRCLFLLIMLQIEVPAYSMLDAKRKHDLLLTTHLPEADTRPIAKNLGINVLDRCPDQIKSIINDWKKRHGAPINLINHSRYETIPKKLLLIGPEGTGKATIGKAIAEACDMPFFRYRAAALVIGSRNSGVEQLKTVFAKAAALHRPCIIIIDELEAFVDQRNNCLDDGATMLACLTSQLARYEKHPILFIGTMREATEAAAIKNLFGQQTIEILLPNEVQRKNILDYYMSPIEGAPLSADVSSRKLAKRTEGFSPRELQEFIRDIRYKRFEPDYDRRAFTMQDCVQELEERNKIKRQFAIPAYKRAYQQTRVFLKKHNKAVNAIIGIAVIALAYYVLVYDRKSSKKKHPLSKQLLTWQELRPFAQSLKAVKFS